MHYSSRRPYADTLSLSCRDHLPISAGKLVASSISVGRTTGSPVILAWHR